MKKKYVKPVVYAENFVLNEYISTCASYATFNADCTGNDDTIWAIIDTYPGIFTTSANGTCATIVTNNKELGSVTGQNSDNDLFCYHSLAIVFGS